MKNLIFSHILSQPWMISPEFIRANLPLIAGYITGQPMDPDQNFSQNRLNHRPFAITGRDITSKHRLSEAPKGSIAVIQVKGVMMKEDQFRGPRGTASIAEDIVSADRDPNIEAMVIIMDSPGGSVDGTESLARTIAETSKPAIIWVDGCMCSAALWAGSAGDEIIASGSTDVIGSIGTMISLVNPRAYFEEAGIKFHDIRASKSVNKNREILEVLQNGNEDLIRVNSLDPLNEIFIAAVKKNRAGKVKEDHEELFTGKTYYSQQAIEMGLIDSIGSLQYAIERASAMASANILSSAKQTSEMKFSIKNGWAALLAALNLSASSEAETVETEITAEQLEGINQKLEEIPTLKQTIQEQDQEIERLQAESEEKDSLIEQLSKTPEQASTEVKKQGDDKIQTEASRPKYSWEIKAEQRKAANG